MPLSVHRFVPPPAFAVAFAATFVVLPGAAFAHPGHLAEVAGHGHWLGAAAIGAAIAIGLWQALGGRRAAAGADDRDAEDEAEADAADEDLQEA